MPARVTILDHPFDISRRVTRELPAGAPLNLQERVGHHWHVLLNGKPVAVDVLPPLRDGDIITARRMPEDPGTIIVVATLLAKAAAVLVPAGATIAGVNAGLVVAGAVFLGAVAVGFAVAPGFSQDIDTGGRVPGADPFYAVTGARNQLRPHGVIPRHYGRIRVTPDLLGLPQTTVSDAGVQAVRQLFCIGQGAYNALTGFTLSGTQIRYGTQPVSALAVSNFQWYVVANSPTASAALTVYKRNIFEEQLNLNLRHEAEVGSVVHTRTTELDALGFDVQLVFPSGLWRISDSGRQQIAKVGVLVRYRPTSGGDWTILANEELKGFIVQRFVRNYHADTSPDEYEVEVSLTAVMHRGLYTKDRGGSGGSEALTGDAIWLSLRTYLLGNTFVDDRVERLTMIGLEIEANVLANGQLDQISALVDSNIPHWVPGSGWTDVTFGIHSSAAYTADFQNPAWQMANELREAGVPDSLIDAQAFYDFAAFCAAKGWKRNASHVDQTTLNDTLREIASCGQGAPVRRGSLYSVTWDELREPVACYGPFNMREFTSTQLPIEEVHAVRVRFLNESLDYQADEMVVYFDGHDASTASIYRADDVLNGLTDPELVHRFVHLQRQKAILRNTFYRWKTDVTSLIVEVGDVVLLRYHLALIGDAETRITSYTTKNAGAHFDEVFFSPAVRLVAGESYSLRVRSRDEGDDGGFRILTLPVVNPLTAGVQTFTALTVDGDVAVPTYGSPATADELENQLAYLGEPEEGRMLVLDVELEHHGYGTVTAVDLAPELFDFVPPSFVHVGGVDSTVLAQKTPGQPRSPVYYHPDNPTLGMPYLEVLPGLFSGGLPEVRVVVPLSPPEPDTGEVAFYRLRYRHIAEDGVTLITGWSNPIDKPAPADRIDIDRLPVIASPYIDMTVVAHGPTGLISTEYKIYGFRMFDAL